MFLGSFGQRLDESLLLLPVDVNVSSSVHDDSNHNDDIVLV